MFATRTYFHTFQKQNLWKPGINGSHFGDGDFTIYRFVFLFVIAVCHRNDNDRIALDTFTVLHTFTMI